MENAHLTAILGFFVAIAILAIILFMIFQMIKHLSQANRKYADERKRQRAFLEQREHEMALAREKRATAEAEKELRKTEARMRETELQEKRNQKNALERSTVTIGGRTKSVADIVSEHIEQEITGLQSSSAAAAGIERLNMAQVKCVQCGGSIEPGSKFCKFCGTQVPENVFRAEIKIHDEAQLKETEYRREREKRLSYRFAETQKAAAERLNASTEKIRAKSEARKIEIAEKARKQKLEEEERKRQHEERMAKARAAQFKSGIFLMLLVILAFIGLMVLASSYR